MNKFLFCVDSDGCAMDTMTIKHVKCFGPRMVEEWKLDKWKDELLKRWNDINLYTKRRGINRFQGLLQILTEVDESYTKIEGLSELRDWVETTAAFSEANLKVEIVNHPESQILKKALNWSQAVNCSINALKDEEKVEFKGVKEALKKVKTCADLAIVSSANREAMAEEWVRCGIMQYVNYSMAQDVGTKAACLSKMIDEGYDAENILMIGDALGDYNASTKAGVHFYPILAGKEEESWKKFHDTIIDEFVLGKYTVEREKEELDLFMNNLAD